MKPRVRLRAVSIIASVALLCLTFAGCGPGARPPTARFYAVAKSYERGGATVRLKVDRTAINVAEYAFVLLEADAPTGVTVRLPEAPAVAGAGGFSLASSGEEPVRSLAGGATRTVRWYRLEPFLSGEYAVGPLSVEVTGAEGERDSIVTDRVAVRVTSLLPKDYTNLNIKDIEGILRPPWRPPAWSWVVVGVLAAAGAATGAWLWRQARARSLEEPPPRPAHEIANEELDELIADDLVTRGEVKLFYQRVTGILRKYIERRFGLRAPERTTEEFLYELRETSLLSEELKKLLRAFLQHCDLVKFAELRPLGEEIRRTLGSCRDFVQATELAAEPPGNAPGDGEARGV